jgi:DNA-binding MarR family transcriptional regulator
MSKMRTGKTVDERTGIMEQPEETRAISRRPAHLTKAQRATWSVLFEAQQRTLHRIDAELEAAGVGSLGDYDVLYCLYLSPERRRRLSDLAEAALLSRSGLTRLVDRLEARGWLQRQSCPNDRRGQYAVLTDAGLEEMRRIWAIYSQGIATHFATHMSPEELETVRTVFTRIRDSHRAGGPSCISE